MLRAVTPVTFWTSQLPTVVRTCTVFNHFDLETRFAPQMRALFPNFNNFPHFHRKICLANTTATTFSISHLTRWLRTRRFSERIFQPAGATKRRLPSRQTTPLHTQLSHTHTSLSHTTLFTHNFVTHTCIQTHTALWHTTLSHTRLSHTTSSHTTLSHTIFQFSHTTLSHTHTILSDTILTDNFVSHTTSWHTHTTLWHTHAQVSHAQFFHTQLSHIQFPHAQLFHTHNSLTYNTLTLSHAQLFHTHNSLTRNSFTHNCGMRGAWWHRRLFCVAGVALAALEGPLNLEDPSQVNSYQSWPWANQNRRLYSV